MKTPQELKDEATRLRDKLPNESVIDLNAVRAFWKDLDDYDQGTKHQFLLKVADFDREITEANAARWRLFGQLFDLINQL